MIKRIITTMALIENTVVKGGLVIMFIIIIIQTAFRYCLNMPLRWSEELARFVFTWTVFVGLSFGLREEAHIRMTFIRDKMSPRVKIKVDMLLTLLMIITVICMFPYSVNLVIRQHKIISPGLGIPMSWVFLCFPVSMIMSFVRLLINMAKEFKSLTGVT